MKEVEQVTFSAAPTRSPPNSPCLFITERAVFELQDGVVTLTEIAPGVRLEEDVLAQMDFCPAHFSHTQVDACRHLPGEVGRPAQDP